MPFQLLELQRAPAEEVVEDEGDNRLGPTRHQRTVSAAPRARLALCCSALTGCPQCHQEGDCGKMQHASRKIYHHLTV